MADANSNMPCHAHATLCYGPEKSLSKWHGRGMAQAWHGICESNMAALCKSNRKDKSKRLAAQHGRGMAWAWRGHSVSMAWEWHGMCELALK
jgi:hypothetical protein